MFWRYFSGALFTRTNNLCNSLCGNAIENSFENLIFIIIKNIEYAVQLQTVDHSVRWSMKNAASCVKRCEMQDTPSTWFSNAYCSLESFSGLRLSEGRYDIKIIIQVCFVEYAVLSCCTRQTYSYTWPHKLIRYIYIYIYWLIFMRMHVICSTHWR